MKFSEKLQVHFYIDFASILFVHRIVSRQKIFRIVFCYDETKCNKEQTHSNNDVKHTLIFVSLGKGYFHLEIISSGYNIFCNCISNYSCAFLLITKIIQITLITKIKVQTIKVQIIKVQPTLQNWSHIRNLYWHSDLKK